MKSSKHISRLLIGILILIVILFILDGFTSFEIKNQFVKSLVYIGILFLTPLTLIWNLITCKTLKKKVLTSILPLLILIGLLIIGPTKIAFSSSAWRTQKILYKNGHFSFKKVEFQIQDLGALGIKKRIVKVTYLTDLFIIINPVENDIDQNIEWIKVNEEVNELGLKFP